MNQQILVDQAFVLHLRDYRETSALVELFTEHHGRISVVARGMKRGRSPLRGVLQPGNLLTVSWQGRTGLCTLRSAESVIPAPFFRGHRLVSVLYINELMVRLLRHEDVHASLFAAYANALLQLQDAVEVEVVLRLFEKTLLSAIGYELQLTMDKEQNQTVAETEWYAYDPERGPVKVEISIEKRPGNLPLFKGASLLALHQGLLSSKEILQDVKRLMRQVLAFHLGDRPLESRKLV